ncbi:hypothetical protein LZS99_13890 [Vibrio fluvialis]|uniref:hypothetical protein n=1 Tax=Vibrio fluvialis TaxID=676 RepID=UPI001F3E94FF|nr:hypothetical protein [Vibrio fluvialis]EKO3839120.1 hypothetical protein [Vibrio harveyi]ELI3523943.1 hypothetical protein [Vibrio vulnificus]MCE7586661.1 hypothetical protein [Vibrio fluvialis]
MDKAEVLATHTAQGEIEKNTLGYFLGLLQDDSQYITWALVFIGWAITIVIAIVQWKKNKTVVQEASHNEWVREFREKLADLEDEALRFWMMPSEESDDSRTMNKLTRGVKELTTIASEIKKVGGVDYQSELFKELRRAVTNDKEMEARPLDNKHYRVLSIKTTSTSLRQKYKRKN